MYSAALVLFWVGESLLNVSIYAGDALDLQLPLLGGEDSIHDWNYLLGSTGLLPSTHKIAAAIRIAGTLAIFAAIFFSLKHTRRDERKANMSGNGLASSLRFHFAGILCDAVPA